MGFDICAVD